MAILYKTIAAECLGTKYLKIELEARELVNANSINAFESVSSKASVLLGADAKSPFSIDFHPLVRLWRNGGSKYFEENMTVVDDGESWMQAIRSQGPRAATYNYKQMTASLSRGKSWKYPIWAIGEFFLPGHLDILGSIPSCLLSDKKSLTDLEIQQAIEGNLIKISLCRKLSDKGDSFSMANDVDTLWVDPQQSFAPVKRIVQFNLKKDKHSQFGYEDTFSRYEIIDGVPIPFEATRVYSEGGEEKFRTIFKITSAEIVERPTSWMPNLEKGWTVKDERYNTTFRIGDDPETIKQKSEASVPK